jgi:hypothetical protein
MMNRDSTYSRLLKLLSDGQWHDEDDLRKITSFPGEWLKELRYDGHEVAVDERGAPIVRLKSLEFPSEVITASP